MEALEGPPLPSGSCHFLQVGPVALNGAVRYSVGLLLALAEWGGALGLWLAGLWLTGTVR